MSEPVAAAALADFVARAFVALGVPEAEAAQVAGLMVEADLLGYDTHGVFRLRQYVNRLRDGGCNPAPRVRVVRETAATALVDGDNGLGHLAMTRARDLAMEKARAAGIGWVGVRGGNHAGPAALYVRPQAAARMIGLAGAVGSANHVAPFGGTDILLGTNPIAVAAPGAATDPFVLDMATTVAAVGKIKLLAQRGEPMPEGWMVGRDGKPLTDPAPPGRGLPAADRRGEGLRPRPRHRPARGRAERRRASAATSSTSPATPPARPTPASSSPRSTSPPSATRRRSPPPRPGSSPSSAPRRRCPATTRCASPATAAAPPAPGAPRRACRCNPGLRGELAAIAAELGIAGVGGR